MSPLCTPFETLPVTVEDGDGLDVAGGGDGVEDDELVVGLGVGVGVGVGEEDWLGTVLGAGAAAALCDVWPRPTATTAPAVPPAINTHPTANAAIAVRLRPAPGIPSPGNVKHS